MLSEDEASSLRIWFHVQSALLGIIFVLTLVLNSLLIFVLHQMKSRRSNRDCASYNIERSYMYLLLHLALADMLGVILNIPFDIFRNAGISYYFSNASCKILPPFQLASTTAQAGTYVALSYHRFRAIVHPIRAILTVCKSFIMIAIIWVISICLSMPYAIVQKFNGTTQICFEQWSKDAMNIYTFAIFVVQYAAPVILMAVFYVTIARTLHEHRVAKELVHVPTQEDVRTHRHIVKMLVTIVTVYSICMLPHHLFWIVTGLQDVKPTVYETLSSVSYLFTYSNSIANPLVFFFYNKESRYHLRRCVVRLGCYWARTIEVPFEIKKWSATSSAHSKSDTPRTYEMRSSKAHLKLDQLFPTKPGDSDLGVSLPWEAQVLNSHVSSDYFPSSPPVSEHYEYTGNTLGPPSDDTTDLFMYCAVPQGPKTSPSETTLDIAHGDEEDVADDVNAGEFHEENFWDCDQPVCKNDDEISAVDGGETLEGNKAEGLSQNVDEGLSENEEGVCESNEDGLGDATSSDEGEDSPEDDTARVQHMIERMMQDIRHELKQDGGMNGMKRLEDILNLNESSSNGDWQAMNSGEGLNGSLAHLGFSVQDLVEDVTGSLGQNAEQGTDKDIHVLQERLRNLPETRM